MTTTLVDDSYRDAFGERRATSPEVRRAVLAAMELAPDAAPDETPHVAVVRRGDRLPAPGSLALEDGTDLGRADVMPPDAPYGYHRLLRDDGVDQLLLTGPGRCHLPPAVAAWGWTVQLAALRSARSWGIGDLDDLRRLAEWSARRGAGFVAVSPLGAPNPGPMPEPSPYYPSTRRFGNPLHLAIEALPGAASLADLAAEGMALDAERRIDRPRVLALKAAALDRLRAGATDGDDEEGTTDAALRRWATFAAITERHGPGWQRWPAELRDPRSPAVAAIAAEAADRVGFHTWVQRRFDEQLAAASAPLRRIADMPVGVDPGGFDAWDWQRQLAVGATVGAPPDRFNASGQDWGLPPFIPHRLREDRYRPFIETIRAQLRHAGGLRIDHVLGLFRLWWVPAGADPAEGAYVRYPTDELLEIVAVESHRARALIVGEDLGTVPAGVRAALRRRNVLSTRLVLFERKPPEAYPRQAFAAVTTHDLPTIAGLWHGSDLADQAGAGVRADPDAAAVLRGRLMDAAGPQRPSDEEALTLAVHRRLAGAPSMLVAASLEDALGVEERPNLPGTVAPARDNWSLALPVTLEELREQPRVGRLVEALARAPR